METRIDRIKKQLHSSSYKLTPQREATVRVLLENEEDHLSAEDVYLLVKEKSPEIGLATTVYRTLELLTELKVVDKINFGDGVSRYDLRKEGPPISITTWFVWNAVRLLKLKKICLKTWKKSLKRIGNLK